MLRYEQLMIKSWASEPAVTCRLLKRHRKKSALVNRNHLFSPKCNSGPSDLNGDEQVELRALIACLEAYVAEGDGAVLSRDTFDRIKALAFERPQARKSGILCAHETFDFRIDAWTKNGAFEDCLGGSDDEIIARAMFAEAVKQLASRNITLSRGPAVLEKAP
jgi:hypothetical protein